MEKQNFETVKYLAEGMTRRFKVTLNNPRDFKIGDRYVVLGVSVKEQIVVSDRNAEKINNSILSGDKIRRVLN